MLALSFLTLLAARPDAQLDVQISTRGSTCQVIRHDAPEPGWSFEVVPTPGEREGAEDCRPLAALYVKVARASCAPNALQSLQVSLTDPLSIELPARHVAGFTGSALRIGCATVRTSADGSVRSWVISHSGYDDLNGRLYRGAALLQWKTPEGRLHLVDARTPDLSLDSDIESIEPLPGMADTWLFTGISVRGDFLRFARALRLDRDGRATITRAFRVGTTMKDELVLRAPVPETGKNRHSWLLHRWLRFDPQKRQLLLEPPPAEHLPQFLKPSLLPSEIVAEWREGRLEVQGRSWGDITLR